jgi:hypothetical protein
MFKAFGTIKYCSFPSTYEYQIIDSDFETLEISAVNLSNGESVIGMRIKIVIECYTKRGLPVAPNVIRALLWHVKEYHYSLDDMVSWNKKHNPLWHEVEKDIQMYLAFS